MDIGGALLSQDIRKELDMNLPPLMMAAIFACPSRLPTSALSKASALVPRPEPRITIG